MRLIFSINPGRCGSKYISTIFSNCTNVLSVHEEPPFFENVMRKGQTNFNIIRDFIKNKKIPAIKKNLNIKNKNIYLETSHMFSCGFFEEFIKLNIIPEILVIKRNTIDVAKSLFCLNTIPYRTVKGLKYLLHPDDSNIFINIKNWKKLTDFQLCYWYVLEINKRAKIYSDIILQKNGKIFETSIDEIKNEKKFKKLCTNMNIIINNKDNYFKIVDKKINTKDNKKINFISTEDINKQINDFNRNFLWKK